MKVRDLTITALFAALICVCAPLSIAIGPVSITLATFAVYLAASVLGWKRGTLAVIVYILIGAVGVPVFSNFSGGLQKLIGVTGGYIVGYIPCALIVGYFSDKWSKVWSYILGMVVGTVVLYALGTVWFIFVAKSTLSYAMSVCVIPFLPLDTVKIICASILAIKLRPLVINKLIAA
jgi:biotin transport system substrate-specific component